MSNFDKPGINYCKKDGKTHRYVERRKINFPGTVHKLFIGGETLSQKKKLKLYNSTYDNLMPGVEYSLNKARHWDIFKSLTSVIEQVTPENNEYSVAMVKGMVATSGGAYESLAIKKPKKEIKFLTVNSGNGASFTCLYNELDETKKKKQKYSALKNFRETPSILFVVEERHPSNHVLESSVYRWKSEKWFRKNFKTLSINIYEDDEICDEALLIDPCISTHQTNLTIGDCFVQKSTQNNARRKISSSFEDVTLKDSAFDKIKQRPQIVFESSLSNDQNIESAVFLYNKNSISSLNFDGIEFMYDQLWVNEEKTKCLFIIPKALKKACSNFDSFMILEFIDGMKKRLRVTTNSIHKKTNFPSTNVYLNLKEIIIKIWRTSVNNPLICDSKNYFSYASFSTVVGKPVGDFDLLFQHQSTFIEANDYEVLTTANRCNICNYKNATVLATCSHSLCQKCATKMIRNQIDEYADKLCCSLCSSVLNPIFVFYSTPLLLLRAYLRSKFFEDKNTAKCPNCNDDLIFDDDIDAVNIKCSQCCFVFCQHCKEAPHFPLPCTKTHEWTKRLLKQTWFTYYGDFECTCKCRIEFSRNHKYLEYENKTIHCPGFNNTCHKQYVLSWPKLQLPRMLNSHKSITKFFQETDHPNFISNSFSSISVFAFHNRITMNYQNMMVKKIAKICTSLASSEARKMVIKSLHFLEYGTALVYFKKKNLSKNEKLLKQYLSILHSIMVQIEICDVNSLPAAKRKLILWQKILDKVFSLCTVSDFNFK